MHDAGGRHQHQTGNRLAVGEVDASRAGIARVSADDLHAVADALPDGTLVLDESGTVRYANAVAESQLGDGSPGCLLGTPFGLPVTGWRDSSALEVPTPNGSYRVLEVWSSAIEWRGESAYLCTTRDVTSNTRQLTSLRQSVERFALAIDGSNDGLWDWEIEEGTLYVSHRWRELVGLTHLPDDDHEPGMWLDRTHASDKTTLLDEIENHLLGNTGLLSIEHRLLHEDGSYRWMLARGRAVFDVDGEPIRLAGSLTDISKQKSLELQLIHEARHDPLTGLGNRRLLLERTERVGARTARTGMTYAIALLDLDGFKAVNDRHGHEVGDAVLIEVARRLQRSIRPNDLAARLGGDEFALVLEDLGGDDGTDHAEHIASRLHDALGRDHRVDELDLSVPASIGVAVASTGTTPVSELLRRADEAMYRAKLSGRPVVASA